jgi:hypothetical protein
MDPIDATIPKPAPNPLPPELEAQLAEILRRRQMSQMFMQQGLQGANQPTQYTPGPYGQAVKGGIAPLAQALQVYMGRKGLAEADQKVGQIGVQAEQDRQRQMRELMGMSDPQAAQQYGMSSSNPMVRAFTEQIMKRRHESAQNAGKVLGDYGDPSAAMDALRTDTVPSGYQPKPLPALRLGQIPGPNGPLNYGVTQNRKGEQSIHGLGGQTINVDSKVDLKGKSVALEHQPKVLETARQTALDALEGRRQAEQIMTLAKDPSVISGFGANPQLGLAALAAKMGWAPNEAPAKTQALMSGIAAQTLEASKELKGAISEKEKPFLEEAKAGRIAYTPEALQHLAGISMALNHNRYLNAVQQYNSALTVEGGEETGKLFPMPQMGVYNMPKEQFPETVNGRVRFNSPLVAPQAAPPQKPIGSMTPEEKAAEIARLRKQLGM